MPRTLQEILDHADELAKVFEEHEPDGPPTFVGPLGAVAEAFRDLAAAESKLHDAVVAARQLRHTWSDIGAVVGTSAEAARQRYGDPG